VITAIAFDGQDDADDTIEVYVDNEPENSPPGVAITEPDNGDTVSGTIVVWICAWDLDGNDQIVSVWARIDHGEWRNATHNHTDDECSWWYYEWDSTEVEDGWHDIGAIAYDGIAYADIDIEVYVDNTPENHPPGVEITEPDNAETVSGTIMVWICAWDLDGNDQIENVWVRIDWGDLRNATHNHTDDECSWWYYEWNTTEVEDGWHVITAIAFDGQDDADDTIEVYVDNEPENSPPGIRIDEPEDGDAVSGTIVIWMCAWDPDGEEDIENVWVRIDDGDLREATYNNSDDECSYWYYEWDTTEVEDGWHLVRAIVYDGEDDGHFAIEVNVENDVGGIGPIDPALPRKGTYGILILTVALVGIMGAFSALAGTEVGRFALFKFMILPLYTKIRKKDVLDQFVRGEIYGYIKVNPGDNYSTIKKNLELTNGTLTYHLLVLEREGLIKSWSQNGNKYFYPMNVKVPDNGLKSPSIHDSILKSIRESPGITVKDIAAVNGISRQLANYHVRKMAAEGKIELERKSFSKVCYPKELITE
jgi:predicted transcriptional regulator